MNGGELGGDFLDYEGLLLVHCASVCYVWEMKERGIPGRADNEGVGPIEGEGPASCQVINRCDVLSEQIIEKQLADTRTS